MSINKKKRMDLAGTPRSERGKSEAVTVEPGVYRWPFALRYYNNY